MRSATVERKTAETEISAKLEILEYGKKGSFSGSTGVGFFDHMLSAFCTHGGFYLDMKVKGDLHVDAHHTVEDCGIVLGEALYKALGDKVGITRFSSFYIPMDEALAFCSVDISGRPYLVFDSEFKSDKVGDYETQLTVEFFRAFATNAKITLHIRCLYGDNDHHKTEAIFKACGKCLQNAVKICSDEVMSSKGVLA